MTAKRKHLGGLEGRRVRERRKGDGQHRFFWKKSLHGERQPSDREASDLAGARREYHEGARGAATVITKICVSVCRPPPSRHYLAITHTRDPSARVAAPGGPATRSRFCQSIFRLSYVTLAVSSLSCRNSNPTRTAHHATHQRAATRVQAPVRTRRLCFPWSFPRRAASPFVLAASDSRIQTTTVTCAAPSLTGLPPQGHVLRLDAQAHPPSGEGYIALCSLHRDRSVAPASAATTAAASATATAERDVVARCTAAARLQHHANGEHHEN